jgi:hypothetical protein
MKSNPKAQGFFDSPFARCESRLEKADIELFPEPSIQAHFGRTLKKLFPLPRNIPSLTKCTFCCKRFKRSSKKDFDFHLRPKPTGQLPAQTKVPGRPHAGETPDAEQIIEGLKRDALNWHCQNPSKAAISAQQGRVPNAAPHRSIIAAPSIGVNQT